MDSTPVGTRSLNDTIDRNGLTTSLDSDGGPAAAADEDDDDDDDDDDVEVLNRCCSNLPLTTSSTCHHLDCATSSWCSVSRTELHFKSADKRRAKSNDSFCSNRLDRRLLEQNKSASTDSAQQPCDQLAGIYNLRRGV